MRILVTNPSRLLLGGAEKYLELLLPALARRGHSLALLYEHPFDDGAATIDGLAGDLPAWCSDEIGLSSLLDQVAAWNPDVVYTQGFDDPNLEDALLNRYFSVLYAHTYYGTCLSGRKCYSAPRFRPCSRRFGASCLLMYYPRRCGGLNPTTMWRLLEIQSRRKKRLKDYQAIIVGSSHMRHEYELNGVSSQKLWVLPCPNAHTPDEIIPMPRNPGGRLLFLGRLMDVKGTDYLLRAMPLASSKLSRHLELTIAGDGPERKKLQEIAHRFAIDVQWAGWVGGQRRSELLRAADLLMVPSLWPEPFGLGGAEAGSVGLPSVGYANGGIPDWLIPGQTGELAPANPPTVEGLAEAIVRALASPSHYQNLRLGAWEMSKRYAPHQHIESLEQILAFSILPAPERVRCLGSLP